VQPIQFHAFKVALAARVRPAPFFGAGQRMVWFSMQAEKQKQQNQQLAHPQVSPAGLAFVPKLIETALGFVAASLAGSPSKLPIVE
jgi:hypothetical protein